VLLAAAEVAGTALPKAAAMTATAPRLTAAGLKLRIRIPLGEE
jgi:hypothetical protein